MLFSIQLKLIISFLILKSSAKLAYESNGYTGNDVDSDMDAHVHKVRANFYIVGDPLWVLTLSDDAELLNPKLRLGNSEEAEDFFNYFEPMIRKSRNRSPVRVKKNDPKQSTKAPVTVNSQPQQKSNKELLKDIVQLINKFVLSINSEPDSYLTNTSYNSEEPSIEFYFKGPYTIMLVKLGRNEWHYNIDVPSLYPQWFFESHDTRDSPILIPEDVKTKFYNSLPQLFNLVLRFPLKIN